jgi:hypothetical protein
MSGDRAIKVLSLLLVASIIVTASTVLVENSSPKLAGTSVNVLPADVIWEKTYGKSPGKRRGSSNPNDPSSRRRANLKFYPCWNRNAGSFNLLFTPGEETSGEDRWDLSS